MFSLFVAALITGVRMMINKSIVNSITSTEYILLYSILLFITVSIIYSREKTNNIYSLTPKHYAIISFSVFSTLYLTNISFSSMKNNTTIQTQYVIKAFKVMILLFISKFIFQEKITKTKMIGLLFIIFGILLVH